MCLWKMEMLLLLFGLLSLAFEAAAFTPLFPSLDISLPGVQNGPCQREALLLHEGLNNQTLWAMRMWDASAQGSTGALFGSTWEMGNFDECLRIVEPIRAKYCLLNVRVELDSVNEPENVWEFVKETEGVSYLSRNLLHTAVCVPASCSVHDLEENFQTQLDKHNQTYGVRYKISVIPEMCTDNVEGPEATDGEIMFWIVCVLIFAASIIGVALPKELTGRTATIFRCFSLKDNISHLFHVSAAEKSHPLAALHGVKVISIVLVFYGHRVGVPLGLGVSNYEEVETLRRTPQNMFMTQLDLVVDTFFFISGVLATYFLCRMVSKNSVNPFQALLVRLARIAPTYYVIVWFQASAALRFGSGPVWNLIVGKESENCANYWWANVLFVNNYLPAEKICHVHSWFLSCDIHFFILAILLVLLLVRRPIIGKSLLALLVLLTPVIPAIVVYVYSMDPIIMFYDPFLSNPRSSEVFGTLYIRSHYRVSVYLIGIAVGYCLHVKHDSKWKISKPCAIWASLIAVAVLFTPIAIGGMYYAKNPPGLIASSIYTAFRRPLWAIGLTILLAVQRFGPENPFSKVLTSKPALILSKLTFSVYLIHYLLILFTVAKTRIPKPFSCFDIGVQGAGELMASCMYAAALYVFLELPLKRLPREVAFTKTAANEIKKSCPPPQEIFTAKL